MEYLRGTKKRLSHGPRETDVHVNVSSQQHQGVSRGCACYFTPESSNLTGGVEESGSEALCAKKQA